jgi:hypothetical protein
MPFWTPLSFRWTVPLLIVCDILSSVFWADGRDTSQPLYLLLTVRIQDLGFKKSAIFLDLKQPEGEIIINKTNFMFLFNFHCITEKIAIAKQHFFKVAIAIAEVHLQVAELQLLTLKKSCPLGHILRVISS